MIFKLSLEKVCVIILLAVAFLLRFSLMDHPGGFNGGDGHTDYLVAQHILKGEFPKVGPNNGLISGLGNSPFYYYFLAAVIVVTGAPLGISIFFIGMQCLCVLAVYLIARECFGKIAGAIAAALLAFAPLYMFDGAGFVWQPRLMETFLLFSGVSLLYGWNKKGFGLLIISQILYMFAIAFHMSALILAPIFFYFLYKKVLDMKSKKVLLTTILSGILFAVLLFAPIFLGLNGEGVGSVQLSPKFDSTLLENSIYRVLYPFSGLHVLVLIFVSTLIYLISEKPIGRSKLFLIIFIVCFLSVVLAIGLFGQGNNVRYFSCSSGIVAVIVGGLLSAALQGGIFLRLIGFFIISSYIFSLSSESIIVQAISNAGSFNRPRNESYNRLTDKVIETIEDVKQREGFDRYDFFHFYGLRWGGYGVNEAVLAAPLEKRLDISLIELSDDVRGFRVLGDGQYIILFCATKDFLSNEYLKERCLVDFKRDKKEYLVLKEIYSEFYVTAYLAKKEGIN